MDLRLGGRAIWVAGSAPRMAVEVARICLEEGASVALFADGDQATLRPLKVRHGLRLLSCGRPAAATLSAQLDRALAWAGPPHALVLGAEQIEGPLGRIWARCAAEQAPEESRVVLVKQLPPSLACSMVGACLEASEFGPEAAALPAVAGGRAAYVFCPSANEFASSSAGGQEEIRWCAPVARLVVFLLSTRMAQAALVDLNGSVHLL